MILAGTGVVGGALYLVVGFLTELPGPGDSWKDWVKFAEAHVQAAQFEVGLWALTVLVLLSFGIYLVVRTKGSHGLALWLSLVALVALGIRVALELVTTSLLAVPTINGGHEFSWSMADLGMQLFTASLLPHAIFLSTLGAAMLLTRSVPRWVGWLTIAVGIVHDLAPVLLILSIFNLLGLLGPIPIVFGVTWYGSLPLWPLITGGALIVQAARAGGTARRRSDFQSS